MSPSDARATAARADQAVSAQTASAQAASAQTAQNQPVLSIGQVLSRLNGEFPDLSSSKLRFFDNEGLVQPARTQSRYRKYTLADIDRIRLILAMQRDHYLPLKIIKKHLADLDAGRPVDLPPKRPASILGSSRPVTRAELLRQTGASAVTLDDAISAGLIPAGESFREDAIVVLTALGSLERIGIGPRHLRSLKAAAEREADLVRSAVDPLRRRSDSGARPRADDLAREVVNALEAIRGRVLQAELASRLA